MYVENEEGVGPFYHRGRKGEKEKSARVQVRSEAAPITLPPIISFSDPTTQIQTTIFRLQTCTHTNILLHSISFLCRAWFLLRSNFLGFGEPSFCIFLSKRQTHLSRDLTAKGSLPLFRNAHCFGLSHSATLRSPVVHSYLRFTEGLWVKLCFLFVLVPSVYESDLGQH